MLPLPPPFFSPSFFALFFLSCFLQVPLFSTFFFSLSYSSLFLSCSLLLGALLCTFTFFAIIDFHLLFLFLLLTQFIATLHLPSPHTHTLTHTKLFLFMFLYKKYGFCSFFPFTPFSCVSVFAHLYTHTPIHHSLPRFLLCVHYLPLLPPPPMLLDLFSSFPIPFFCLAFHLLCKSHLFHLFLSKHLFN